MDERWDDRFARWIWLGRHAATTIEERSRRRVWVRLLPILFFLYILAYIDRANIGIAKLGMNLSPEEGGLGFDDRIIGIGFGMFFWGYWILEIPSTLSVERRGARWVFCRILILWGVIQVLMAFLGMPLLERLLGWLPDLPAPSSTEGWVATFVDDWNGNQAAREFYFLRFMLGFFEGGFFPTVVMYLSIWFKAEHRAKAMASFMAAMALSNVIGAPLSQWIRNHIDWGGLAGWRWIFILEGIAPILAGVGVWFVLPDRPQTAKWLPPEERDWLLGELDREHRERSEREHGAWRKHVGLVLLLTIVYFGQNVVAYGMSTFMPSIIKSVFTENENRVALIFAGIYFLAFLAMQLNGWHSDRQRERVWHVAGPMMMTGVGLLLMSRVADSPPLAAVALILIGLGVYTHIPPFWAIPTMFLGSSAAAASIGFINMIGNFGGFLGPMLIGDASTAKEHGLTSVLSTVAIFPFVAATIVLVVGWWRGQKPKDASGGTP